MFALLQAQEISLNFHCKCEQYVQFASGSFFNFNGTAGGTASLFFTTNICSTADALQDSSLHYKGGTCRVLACSFQDRALIVWLCRLLLLRLPASGPAGCLLLSTRNNLESASHSSYGAVCQEALAAAPAGRHAGSSIKGAGIGPNSWAHQTPCTAGACRHLAAQDDCHSGRLEESHDGGGHGFVAEDLCQWLEGHLSYRHHLYQ